jgi:hypothetical protein
MILVQAIGKLYVVGSDQVWTQSQDVNKIDDDFEKYI